MFGTTGVPFFVLTAKQAQWSRRVIRAIAAFVVGSTEDRRGGRVALLDMPLPLTAKSARLASTVDLANSRSSRRVMGQFEFSFEARCKSSALTNSMATDVRAPQLSFA